MFLRMSNVGIATHLVLAAGAIFGFAGQTHAGGPDVGFSIRIGSPGQPGCVIPPRDCDYAGTLTIDGRSFRIDADRSVRAQIVRAFECLGYDAWFVGGSVRVRIGHCSPEVCWRNGEYGMAFRERHTSITLTPTHCHEHHHGHHYRYGFDAGRGHYFAYSEVQNGGGSASWLSIGATTFVDHDRDLDDEVHSVDRSDDRDSGKRYQPDANRFDRKGDNRSRTDDRSSVPSQPRTDIRKRTETIARQPVTSRPSDLKRTLPAHPPAVIRKDDIKVLPSDRVGNLKRDTSTKPAPRPESKPVAAVKKDDTKQATKTPQPRQAPKASDDKKSKW
jgi:hypothetical protein